MKCKKRMARQNPFEMTTTSNARELIQWNVRINNKVKRMLGSMPTSGTCLCSCRIVTKLRKISIEFFDLHLFIFPKMTMLQRILAPWLIR